MHQTGATTVVRKVAWLHEVVYTAAGKPASYQDISIPQSVHGYMIIMEGEEVAIKERLVSHIKFMSDAKLYSWECRAFHGIWLNQLQQGRCTMM